MNDWIEWKGTDKGGAKIGEGRPGDFEVDYKLRYGAVYKNTPAEQLYWDHTGEGSDIVSYRVSNAAS